MEMFMSNNSYAKRREMRDKFFSLLDEKMKDTNSIYLYHKKLRDDSQWRLRFTIIDKEPKIFLTDYQIRIFKELDIDYIKEKVRGTDYTDYVYAGIDNIKASIESNNTPVSLNKLITGFIGPYLNKDRSTHNYNVYISFLFKTEELKNILMDYSDKFTKTSKTFISIKKETVNLLFSDEESIIISESDNDIEDSDAEEIEEETNEIDTTVRNLILFGPPGTGKSYKIQKQMETIQEDTKAENIIRTTFHPEYSYYDFIGQYKPVVGYELTGGNIYDYRGEKLPKKPFIYYDFVPGPFIKAVIKAIEKDKQRENIALVIEEINRGNSSAIFGDIFQLLDRNYDVDSDDYGRSIYPIDVSVEIKSYIIRELGWTDENWNGYFKDGFVLPKNLFIYATMNTSDQSLFPMDSAFKRRWNMEYVNIDYEEVNLLDKYIKFPHLDKEMRWLDFLKVINRKIVEYTQTDDKQMGQWFITGDGSDINFFSKMYSYLWFDVFRHDPSKMFKDEIKTYDDLIQNRNKGVIRDEILNEVEKAELDNE